jgi:DNA replication licensing factor MCM6
VICRNEIVERAKAGDKVVFTGMIAVSPEKVGLGRTGDVTTSGRSNNRGNNDNNADGAVQGLKELGVREMTYRMFFVASSAILHDQRSAAGAGNGNNAPITILPSDLLDTHDHGENEKEVLISSLSDADIADIKAMHNTSNLYDKMVESLCPQVFGHHEVKRGILLMLCGGVHKRTSEGISLRGDINVCVVGDPSCAKSQFLKFIHDFWPRSVFTSGKSSSAAGLTASVIRDNETGEFCVEAGALMLADNGICCIDEFDKMDPGDQVAIHEAMEQQVCTILSAFYSLFSISNLIDMVTDHFHHQSRNSGDFERSDFNLSSSQSNLWALRSNQDVESKYRDLSTNYESF